MSRAGYRIGARKKPIRMGNPSKSVSSGLIPVTFKERHAKQLWFDGVLEKELLPQLAVDPATVSIDQDIEPFRWFDGKAWHEYRPRFTVRRRNANVFIIEVAWAAIVARDGIRRVLGLVEPFAKARGYAGIELYTDVQIRAPARLFNSHIVGRAGRTPPDNLVLETIMRRAWERGIAQRGHDLTADIVSGRSATSALARLVFEERLELADPGLKIGNDALFQITASEKGGRP